MNQTIQLLQDLLRNARTGENAVDQLREHAGEDELRRALKEESDRYGAFAEEARTRLAAAGGSPEPVGVAARAGMWMGIEMKTLMDASDSHLAELVIQGATMGITEMTKALNSMPDASPDARDLARRFVDWQRQEIDGMKPRLRNAQTTA